MYLNFPYYYAFSNGRREKMLVKKVCPVKQNASFLEPSIKCTGSRVWENGKENFSKSLYCTCTTVAHTLYIRNITFSPTNRKININIMNLFPVYVFLLSCLLEEFGILCACIHCTLYMCMPFYTGHCWIYEKRKPFFFVKPLSTFQFVPYHWLCNNLFYLFCFSITIKLKGSSTRKPFRLHV